MPFTDCANSIPSVVLARALVNAWIEGRFTELDDTLRLCRSALTETEDTGEQERLELVEALAERAKDPDSRPSGPWMKLVTHLAEPMPMPVEAEPQSPWPGEVQTGSIRIETLIIR